MSVTLEDSNEPNFSSQQPQPNEKPQVKIWQIAIAVVALCGYMVWLGVKTFGPPPQFTNAKTRANEALIAKVSPQAGPDGDLEKVNPIDRAAFLKMVGGAPIPPQAILKNYWKSKH